MKDYLLFIDTETSGLPIDWSKPYSAAGNWPFIVQAAWMVYTREGVLVKQENHYIKAEDFTVSEASRKIHGITDAFLQEHGQERAQVMQLLYNDLLQYQPLVVAHFMQLDFHMLSLGFCRAGLENPLKSLPVFCTMKYSADFRHSHRQRFLRLSELYFNLFNSPLENQHDALADASATSRCFFELKKRGHLTDTTIAQQQEYYSEPGGKRKPFRWESNRAFMLLVLGVLMLLFFLTLWLYGR